MGLLPVCSTPTCATGRELIRGSSPVGTKRQVDILTGEKEKSFVFQLCDRKKVPGGVDFLTDDSSGLRTLFHKSTQFHQYSILV